MTDKLKEIFENVNNWLSFAEAKNAALVALESTIIIGFITSDIFKTPVRNCTYRHKMM